MTLQKNIIDYPHCLNSVCIRSYSGPHFLAFGLNTDQNNSEYGHFSRSVHLDEYLHKKLLQQKIFNMSLRYTAKTNICKYIDLFIKTSSRIFKDVLIKTFFTKNYLCQGHPSCQKWLCKIFQFFTIIFHNGYFHNLVYCCQSLVHPISKLVTV